MGILIFFSIGAREQAQNKGDEAAKNKLKKFEFFFNFFPKYYILFYLESFDSFHLDLL